MPYNVVRLKGFRNSRLIFSYYLITNRYFVFIIQISKWFLKFIDTNFRSDDQVISVCSKFYGICLDRLGKNTILKHSFSFISWNLKFITARIRSTGPLPCIESFCFNIITQLWIPYIVEENFYQVAIFSFSRRKLVTAVNSKLEYTFRPLQVSRNETVKETAVHVLQA
jgi:hypothetical protein